VVASAEAAAQHVEHGAVEAGDAVLPTGGPPAPQPMADGQPS